METKYKERNSENPLVSIIVITYNSSKFVIETLESAKAQTYTNIELIISDDCSTDDTMDVCLKWIKENKNRFVRTELITDEKNTGIPANCNRGVKAARGEWIKLIAGDDCLRNDAINIYLNFILKHPEIEFIHADVQAYRNIFEAGNEFEIENPARIKFNKPITTANEQFQILLRLNPIYAATSFISKDLFLKYGLFDEMFTLWEDRPMWLNLTKNGVKLMYLKEITVNYRISNDSVQTKNSANKIFAEFDIIREGYMLNFNNHLGFLERTIKTLEHKRRLFLDKIGLNKIYLIPRIINKISGHFFRLYISRINDKYK